jgi:hypothetical protein
MEIDQSMHTNYTSALNSYLTFCHMHNFNIEPTAHTLSLYVTYQFTFINPSSVNTYLSGICNQIETHFPSIWATCKSVLVTHALQGAKQHYRILVHHKLPLTPGNLLLALANYQK